MAHLLNGAHTIFRPSRARHLLKIAALALAVAEAALGAEHPSMRDRATWLLLVARAKPASSSLKIGYLNCDARRRMLIFGLANQGWGGLKNRPDAGRRTQGLIVALGRPEAARTQAYFEGILGLPQALLPGRNAGRRTQCRSGPLGRARAARTQCRFATSHIRTPPGRKTRRCS